MLGMRVLALEKRGQNWPQQSLIFEIDAISEATLTLKDFLNGRNSEVVESLKV